MTPQAPLHTRARRAHSPAERPPTGWQQAAVAPQVRSTRNRPEPAGREALYAAAMADTDAFDPLETPRCPNHPTTRLIDAGTAADGQDARWQCPVPGCGYTQLAGDHDLAARRPTHPLLRPYV